MQPAIACESDLMGLAFRFDAVMARDLRVKLRRQHLPEYRRCTRSVSMESGLLPPRGHRLLHPAPMAGCCWTSWRAIRPCLPGKTGSTRPGRSWIRSSPDWRVTLRRDFRTTRQDPGVRRLPRSFWRAMAGTGNRGEGGRMESPRHRGYRGSRHRVTPNTARSPWSVRVTALCEVGSRSGMRTTGATGRVLRRPGQPGWRQQ